MQLFRVLLLQHATVLNLMSLLDSETHCIHNSVLQDFIFVIIRNCIKLHWAESEAGFWYVLEACSVLRSW